jgi:hypothetical protein
LLVFQDILLSIHFNIHLDTAPHRRLLVTAVLALSGLDNTAWAQTATSAASAATPMPSQPLAFRSAFESYKPYTDDGAPEWKKANDEVGKIGGWRAYAREAQDTEKGEEKSQSQPTPAKPAQAATQPDPHAGHAKP